MAITTVTVEVGVGVGVPFILEFEAGMSDAEALAQSCFDLALDGLNSCPSIFGDDHVAVERRLVLLHLP